MEYAPAVPADASTIGRCGPLTRPERNLGIALNMIALFELMKKRSKYFRPVRASARAARLPVLFLGAALLLLPACLKVGPDYQPPESKLPPSWSQGSGALNQAALIKWWEIFRDPLLNSLIDRAVKGNLDLKTAYARVKEARHLLGAALGKVLPSADASGQATRQGTSENSAVSTGITYSSYSMQLDASWEIDLFGRIRRNIEAAQADFQASEEDRRDALITLYAEVARTYLQVRTAQIRLITISENIASQKEVLELTLVRFKNGLASALDVSQARQVLASTEAQAPPIRIELTQNKTALAVLLGLPPAGLDQELDQVRALAVPQPKLGLGVPADLLRRRPDIRGAERRLAAQSARVGVATADLYPSFTILGTIGLSAANTGDLFTSGSRIFSVGPGFSWKLFQGGAVRSQIKAADAKLEQNLFTYRQTILNALSEVENAVVALNQRRQQAVILRRAMLAAQRTLNLSVSLYKEGLADFQRVLDAQRTLFESGDQLVQARGAAASALVGLYKALGGGWHLPDQAQAPAAAGQ